MDQQIAEILMDILENQEEQELFSGSSDEENHIAHCYAPQVGRVLRRVSIPYLLEVLEMSDGIFARVYPGSYVDGQERRTHAKEIREHLSLCLPCSQKADVDRSKDTRVAQLLEENRKEIGMVLAHGAGAR